jgi:uncharacterized protein DUF5680
MELVEFIAKAKLNSYADSDRVGDVLSAEGAKEFTYTIGSYFYRDKYFGFNPFMGEEMVWWEGQPIWGMNFYGKVSGTDLAGWPRLSGTASEGNFSRAKRWKSQPSARSWKNAASQ